MRLESLEDRCLPAVIFVTNTNDSGAGSLRAAIQAANTAAGFDEIQFNIPVTDPGHVYYRDDGVLGQVTLANVATTSAADDGAIADVDPDWPHSWFTIRPLTPLPSLRGPALIDGTTQPGAAVNVNPVGQGLSTIQRIEIDGSSAGQVEFGLLGVVASGGATIRGLTLNRAAGPMLFFEFFAPGNTVEGNFLGTDVSGTRAFTPPVVEDPPGFLRSSGVYADSGGHVIGGATPAARNLIAAINFTTSFAAAEGVVLRGFGAPSTVEGNLIGVDRTGTRALGNRGHGISVDSPNNVIANNVISANASGISAVSGNASGTVIRGNWIGTDVTGAVNLGNAGAGVAFGFGDGNQVLANVIAFHQAGVRVGFDSTGNLISRNSMFRNLIGIDLPGPFGLGSVELNDVPPASDPPDQDVGGNNAQNYPILGAVTAVGGGTRITGTLASTPGHVFRLEFFANAERSETALRLFGIPGEYGEGQTWIGELEVATDASGFANFSVDLPVNLLALPGPGGQPFVTTTATDVTDAGSGPANDTSEFSPVVPLGGLSFVVTNTGDTGLGTLREAMISANLTPGHQTITFAIPANDPRHFIYRDDGIAGEVSPDLVVVTNATNDATITDVDPDWPYSWYSIEPQRALPAITETITIDGYSQPGSRPNTLPFPHGLDTILKIEIDGTRVAGAGLVLSFGGQFGVNFTDAANSLIRGLAINAFGGDAIVADTLDGHVTISGNFIGPDVSGLLNFGNGGHGVFVVNESFDVVGGELAADRNLISGNVGHAVKILSGLGIVVTGNVLNGDRIGQAFFETQSAPVLIIIGSEPAQFSPGSNVDASPMGGVGALADPGTAAYAHQLSKLFSHFPKNPFIEGFKHGIMLLEFEVDSLPSSTDFALAEWNSWRQERIEVRHHRPGSNQALALPLAMDGNDVAMPSFMGVDLGGDGVTANDLGDSDEGPNGLQNFPVLTSAVTVGGMTTVTGTLNSLANTSFRIEIYSSSYDTSIYRAGERSLGTIDVTTNASGDASFTFVTSEAVPPGYHVISLATRLFDHDNNPVTPLLPFATSEFSDGIPVTAPGENSPPFFTSTAIVAATAGTEFVYVVTTADPDVGDARTIAATTKPAWLTLVDHGNGTATLSGTPKVGDAGQHLVELKVTDAAGAFATQSFTITVAAPPPAMGDLALRIQNFVEKNKRITFEAVITNNGDQVFRGVTLDQKFLGLDPRVGIYLKALNSRAKPVFVRRDAAQFKLGKLLPGQTATIRFQSVVSQLRRGLPLPTFTLRASVFAKEPDADLSDNVDFVTNAATKQGLINFLARELTQPRKVQGLAL